MTAGKVRTNPRLTFTALAHLMAPHSAAAHVNVLRKHKYPKDGPQLNYVNAIKHMVGVLVDGAPSGGALRSHEQDVVGAFDPALLKLNSKFNFRRTSTKEPLWKYHGVDISMYAEVRLSGPKGSGAVKFYCANDPLAKGVGKAMANLLAYYRAVELQETGTHPGYCKIYEVREGKVYTATSGAVVSTTFLGKVQAACNFATSLWPGLTRK